MPDDIVGNILPGAWSFGRIVRALSPAKPGYFLHLITGKPERTCRAYAADDVEPPAHVLVAMLRSEYGSAVLVAIMDGSTEPWWIELQRAKRVADAIASVG